jgi:DNA-binding transcriptional LysR family regulator
MATCAAPSYLKARGTPRTVAELADHNCLGYTLALSGPHRWSFGRRAEISVPIVGDLRANNGDALLAAAVAGQGIIYQPTFIVADDLRAGRLTSLSLDQPTNERLAVHAVYLPDRHPPAKVRAFIDFIATRFAPEPPWDRGLT